MLRFWSRFDVEIVSAILCLLAGLMLWSAAGCDSDEDGDSWPPWPTWGELGTVYVCDTGIGCLGGAGDEFCWTGPVDDLEDLLGAECHAITPQERLWPALAGCRWACPPEGRGCNASCGCGCEAP